MIEGMNSLQSLIQRLQMRQIHLQSLDGTTYDAKGDGGFQQGPILHKDTDRATEEESVAFEQSHPEVIQHLLKLKNELDRMLK